MATASIATSAAAWSAAREYGRRLRERFGSRVIAVRLFGSTVRGELHEESDVDLAVVLDECDWETRAEAIDLATAIGMTFDLRLSPTVFDRATFDRWLDQERSLVRDIVEQGIPL
jgi:predicted nucleotidyltransferase